MADTSRILICGSREKYWNEAYKIMVCYLIESMLRITPKNVIIMHGAANGVDIWTDNIAKRLGFDIDDFPADWNMHPKTAGFIRNIAMLDKKPYLVCAYQAKGSNGTQHTIDNAQKRNIPTIITKFQ